VLRDYRRCWIASRIVRAFATRTRHALPPHSDEIATYKERLVKQSETEQSMTSVLHMDSDIEQVCIVTAFTRIIRQQKWGGEALLRDGAPVL
jgi:hypothetical protein